MTPEEAMAFVQAQNHSPHPEAPAAYGWISIRIANAGA
jgi:hypothetical protein